MFIEVHESVWVNPEEVAGVYAVQEIELLNLVDYVVVKLKNGGGCNIRTKEPKALVARISEKIARAVGTLSDDGFTQIRERALVETTVKRQKERLTTHLKEAGFPAVAQTIARADTPTYEQILEEVNLSQIIAENDAKDAA